MTYSRYWLMITMLFITIGCSALSAQSGIGAINVTPSLIHVGVPTTVTVTAVMTDPTVLPTSVNLLRVNTDGTTSIIGQLQDNGKSGDVKAGDKIFTVLEPFNEAAEGEIQLQVSAAFQGPQHRISSPIVSIAVSLPGLPPDPGEGGKKTVEGVDSDGDGVRDDVQRYIALTYPNSSKTRAALTQEARSLQQLMKDASAGLASDQDLQNQDGSIDCLFYTAPDTAESLHAALLQQQLNTDARLRVYLTAESQTGAISTLPVNTQVQCMVNPDTLPN